MCFLVLNRFLPIQRQIHIKTFAHGSPDNPKVLPFVFAATNWRTFSSDNARVRAT
jgi:hypothetical protein